MKRINIIFGIIGLVISACVFYMLNSFPEGQPGEVGADFFPYILAYGLGISSLVLVLQSVNRKALEPAEPFNIFEAGIQRAGISLVATIIYCLAMDSLGFLFCTMVYLPLMMFLLKERKYFKMILVSGAITITVFLVFSSFLNITLPLGTIYGY
ncbi:MAG: tripartite tricarboxylate transporter TctB family protein [Kordiimonadaceae bacterium]|jgi:putative tricarboxylic transport membrane protein|nr:tripartite tricarboxylate transporter TctB family protein [Kordiimonadaceae bacterium]MBT6031846.1 tripartite tricarboxylate transporter TctB family protein [Kordiimonadaceae bacterium]